MPKLSKMSNEEVETLKKNKSGQSERERIRQQYMEYLKTFQVGDWVSVELEEGEKKLNVRNRLKSAAKELGYTLKFVRSKNNLKFEIQKAEE